MSGHSKWSQIKRKKGATDAAKSRIFSRFARLITLESKKAEGRHAAPSLKAVIERAKAANMPKENIERAIAKGVSRDAGDVERVLYECYGPAGVAIVVDVLTDSRNRVTQELKHLLSENGVPLAAPGSALWAFTKSGDGSFTAKEPLVDMTENEEEKLCVLLSVLDEYDDVQTVYTNARGYESTESE